MRSILLAESDEVIGNIIKEDLERNNFMVFWAKDGQEAYNLYSINRPDLCVLSIMIPVINGLTVATKIRKLSGEVPIFFLGIGTDSKEVITAFEAGGNDYLKKPFSLDEFQLRVKELLRRYISDQDLITSQSAENIKLGIYYFNPISQILKCSQETFRLSFKESELLKALVIHKNEVMSRNEVLAELWGLNSTAYTRSMDVYVGKLRRYLRHDSRLAILSIKGFGFKLIED